MMSHYLSFGLWLVGTAAMAVWTRHRGVSFCWGFVFGRGLVYYWSAKDGLPEFGGLLHQVWFGLGGWVMAYEVQRRFRRSGIASAPLTYFSTQSRDQWLRLLTAGLLCSGLAWGLTIELLVLPALWVLAEEMRKLKA